MKLDSSVSYFTFLGFVLLCFSFFCLRLGWIGGGLVCAEWTFHKDGQKSLLK
jgi:hypothetical protein